MKKDLDSIREEAFALDVASQAQLAEDIAANLAKQPHMAEWIAEAKERLAEHRRGEGTAIPVDEVIARMKQRIADFKRTGV